MPFAIRLCLLALASPIALACSSIEDPTSSHDALARKYLEVLKTDQRKYFMDSMTCAHTAYYSKHMGYSLMSYIGPDFGIGSMREITKDSVEYQFLYKVNEYSRQAFESQHGMADGVLDSLTIPFVKEQGRWYISMTTVE